MTQTAIDVAIVGGGISGLSVANGLTNHGLSVQLFEARARLGGRIHSVPVSGGVAEMGATWFWDNEPRVRALVDDLGLAVHDQWETGDALLQRRGNLDRVSRPWRSNSRRFSNGASELIEGLAARLPANTIRLHSPVKSLQQTDGHVEVKLDRLAPANDEATENIVVARRAVVALPPSLAIANKIVAGTDLEPDVQRAATQITVWMGAIVKAVAVYDEPFWRADGLSGVASSDVGPVHEIHDISGPSGRPGILFGFGQTRPETGELTPEAFTSQLAALFGSRAANPVDVLIQDWRKQPRTTPSAWPVSSRYDLFGSSGLQRSSWGGKLFWSSTETASIAPGHIEGALEAAERTIRSILTSQ